MSSEIELKRLEQRAFRDANQDGLMEILMGAVFSVASLAWLSPAPAWMPGLFVIFGPLALEALRKRFTYPRIGYVRLRQEPPKRPLLGVRSVPLGMAVYVLIVLGAWVLLLAAAGDVRDASLWRKWCPTLLALMLTGGFIYLADKSGRIWVYGWIVFSIALGVACSLLNFQRSYAAVSAYCLVMAVVFLPCGLVKFVRFLRNHPIRVEEGSDVGQ